MTHNLLIHLFLKFTSRVAKITGSLVTMISQKYFSKIILLYIQADGEIYTSAFTFGKNSLKKTRLCPLIELNFKTPWLRKLNLCIFNSVWDVKYFGKGMINLHEIVIELFPLNVSTYAASGLYGRWVWWGNFTWINHENWAKGYFHLLHQTCSFRVTSSLSKGYQDPCIS